MGKHQPIIGTLQHEQERRLVHYADDLEWVIRYEADVLRAAENEAGHTIGHALHLQAQLAAERRQGAKRRLTDMLYDLSPTHRLTAALAINESMSRN